MTLRAALPLFLVLALLSGCDDMTDQPKAGAWSAQAMLVTPAQDVVAWGDAPIKPPPVTLALLQRGQQRFRIDCTPCHSELGDGHGPLGHRRLYPRPATVAVSAGRRRAGGTMTRVQAAR